MRTVTPETVEQVRKYAAAAERPERYAHSLRVAQCARELCERYGLDADRGYFAGLAHDICKDLDDGTQLLLAAHDGEPVSALEQKKPSLLHGRAAAWKLRNDFGVDDPEVLQAVACHTFGAEDPCPLAKVVFAADKIEPGRPQSTEEYRAALMRGSLDALVLAVLEENIDFLRSKGKEPAPVSLRLKERLERSVAEESR